MPLTAFRSAVDRGWISAISRRELVGGRGRVKVCAAGAWRNIPASASRRFHSRTGAQHTDSSRDPARNVRRGYRTPPYSIDTTTDTTGAILPHLISVSRGAKSPSTRLACEAHAPSAKAREIYRRVGGTQQGRPWRAVFGRVRPLGWGRRVDRPLH